MDNYIITIARGFGSGGKTIGEMLAKMLKIKVYNSEILSLAAENSGINESLFQLADEKVKPGLRKREGVYNGNVMKPYEKEFVSNSNMFNYEAKVIRNLAQTESCVIIGRAADYILRNFSNVISVNIQAPFEVCVAEIMERYKMSEKQAKQEILRTNKSRAEFYEYYTGRKWNDLLNFDLSINSDRLGREKCADYIIEFAELKLGKRIRP